MSLTLIGGCERALLSEVESRICVDWRTTKTKQSGKKLSVSGGCKRNGLNNKPMLVSPVSNGTDEFLRIYHRKKPSFFARLLFCSNSSLPPHLPVLARRQPGGHFKGPVIVADARVADDLTDLLDALGRQLQE